MCGEQLGHVITALGESEARCIVCETRVHYETRQIIQTETTETQLTLI